MAVEVAYATPQRQAIIAVTLPADSTAEQAIRASGILREFPEIDLSVQEIGIFGSACKRDKTIADGDRVEIYRPLVQDPMEARRNRVRK
ncbi:RnfH family protein [Methylomonas methanica]|uniref:RnfH family protein n=1 Tax=Methylomonas methanica TaxID=421 RepID=UPI003CC7F344